jgi:hypothetical protein
VAESSHACVRAIRAVTSGAKMSCTWALSLALSLPIALE